MATNTRTSSFPRGTSVLRKAAYQTYPAPATVSGSQWSQISDPPWKQVTLNPETREAIHWWRDLLNLNKRVPPGDINVLELKAIGLGLQTIANTLQNSYVSIMCDNTSAIVFLKNQGGDALSCILATQICRWVE